MRNEFQLKNKNEKKKHKNPAKQIQNMSFYLKLIGYHADATTNGGQKKRNKLVVK